MERYASRAAELPQLRGLALVTDGGIETDLIHNRGIDLRDFAAFPLVEDEPGRRVLSEYFDEYAAIAARERAGLLLETPTWRASRDWGRRLGYSAAGLRRVNAHAIGLLTELRDRYTPQVGHVVISGQVGPRDHEQGGGPSGPEAAADYHRPQLEVFAAEGADIACAMTLDNSAEAIGITWAAHDTGLPVAISFTVERDGRLPDQTSLEQAIAEVDAAAHPEYFMINCAHPSHIAQAFDRPDATSQQEDPEGWPARIRGVRYNASELSHAELDEATELDRGDLEVLAAGHLRLAPYLPALSVLGGCCGTDASHVSRLWQVAQFPAGQAAAP